MLYSKYCEYVIRGLAYLSKHGKKDKYLMVKEISTAANIPFHFLQKIFQDLVATQWVTSKKGKNGGFAMVADAKKLTLMEVVKWSDGAHHFSKCILGDRDCGDHEECMTHNRCSVLKNDLVSFFNTVTISDVSEIDVIKKKQGKK